jgi:DNA-binding ferritin-like protein
MDTIAERILEFSKIPLEEKKTKLIAMTQELKDLDPVFSDIYINLQNNTNLADNLLNEIYQDILELAEAIKNNDKARVMTKIQSMQATIQKIHDMEAVDRTKEHPEDLLNQL